MPGVVATFGADVDDLQQVAQVDEPEQRRARRGRRSAGSHGRFGGGGSNPAPSARLSVSTVSAGFASALPSVSKLASNGVSSLR